MRISMLISALLISGVLASCGGQPLLVPAGESGSQPAQPTDFYNITWQWSAWTQREPASRQTVPDPEAYTLIFRPDGSVHIQADCNLVQGSYEATDGGLAIQLGPSTLAFCGEESLDQLLLSSLARVDSVALVDGEMVLGAGQGAVVLSFADGGAPEAVAAQIESAAVTGRVAYRERIALPPDAVLRVQIQDVSVADAPATVMGEQVIEPVGQVPIPFTVGYNPADIDERNIYSLFAVIADGSGKLLFISDTHTPVITGGNPTHDVEMVLVQVAD